MPEGGEQMASGRAPTVFISYASQDAAIANVVVAALERVGIACWIAPRDVRAGEPYAAAIVNAINDSKMLVLLLSQHAIASPHVLREVERASSKRRPILSIRLTATELPPELEYFLSADQWLDASGGSIGKILPALVEAVGARGSGNRAHDSLGRGGSAPGTLPHPVSPPSTGRWLSRWRLSVLMLALAVVAAGFAYLAAEKAWLSKRTVAPQPAVHVAPAVADKSVTALPATPAARSGNLPAGSVAVLPFASLTDDPASQNLSIAIAAAVHHRLSLQRGLLVVARSSSLAVGGASDAKEAGRQLGARYLVGGTVQRVDRQVRVTAELVDAFTGNSVRALRFDRTVDDALAVQDEIADRVAAALEVTVQTTASDYSRYGLEAYLAYLRGSALLSTRKFADADAAVGELTRATKLAPRFSGAYASLALAKFQQLFVRNQYTDKTAKALWKSIYPLITQALALDPKNGEAYFMRGKYKFAYLGDDDGAEADYRTGMTLSPNFGPGLADFADFLNGERHQAPEALAILDRAARVDPLQPRTPYLTGLILWWERGDLGGAAAAFRRATEVAPDFYPAYLRLAQLEWIQGRLVDGIQFAEKAIDLEPGVVWGRVYLMDFYLDAGEIASARDVLQGLAEPPSGAQALLCTRAGKFEVAEKLLRKAIAEPTFGLHEPNDWLALYGVVAHILAQHRYAVATRLLRPAVSNPAHPGTLVFNEHNVEGLALLAAAEVAAGDASAGRKLAEEVLNLAAKIPFAWYGGRAQLMRAMALAVLGRTNEALAALGQIQATAGRLGWWDTYGGNPALESLRPLPQFQALAAEARKWSEREHSLLERERAAHHLPQRDGAPASASGC